MYEVSITYVFDDEATANLTADEAWSAGAETVTIREVSE